MARARLRCPGARSVTLATLLHRNTTLETTQQHGNLSYLSSSKSSALANSSPQSFCHHLQQARHSVRLYLPLLPVMVQSKSLGDGGESRGSVSQPSTGCGRQMPVKLAVLKTGLIEESRLEEKEVMSG